ncbi:hypothetical protein AZE42_03740 [Rhizopogon vesiculosus]|uniref:Uncharacterized protein n=1 Tax=Rhizopogon vesiculosus TaxID=180088 RepID=A0A1J8QDP0_9AGAM|nr:hypothetical protein AZE42_03740 [Rhizopogon vesiculosus]
MGNVQAHALNPVAGHWHRGGAVILQKIPRDAGHRWAWIDMCRTIRTDQTNYIEVGTLEDERSRNSPLPTSFSFIRKT